MSDSTMSERIGVLLVICALALFVFLVVCGEIYLVFYAKADGGVFLGILVLAMLLLMDGVAVLGISGGLK
jgi:hypothetical protein